MTSVDRHATQQDVLIGPVSHRHEQMDPKTFRESRH
jgi:hypothetical protein